METFENDIMGAVGHHLTDEHIGPIMDYVLKPEMKDKMKDYVQLDAAKMLLGAYAHLCAPIRPTPSNTLERNK